MKRDYSLKTVTISRRSRTRVTLMRLILRPLSWLLLRFMGLASRINVQLRLASFKRVRWDHSQLDYRLWPQSQGFVFGDPGNGRTVLLYLHGGGFVLPAMPRVHLAFVRRICRDMGCDAYMPDYRLAPLHKYPAAVDDCEMAYRDLLDAGIDPQRIVIAGESAGGNLVLALLQRIRRRNLPNPACAVSISPLAEMARVHAPPSRTDNASRDAMISVWLLQGVLRDYAAGLDAHDPELSTIRGDYAGCPPLHVLVGDSEVLLDDALLVARRAREQGVNVKLDVWPVLPHAFPLLEGTFPEARQARQDIIDFALTHLKSPARASSDRAA